MPPFIIHYVLEEHGWGYLEFRCGNEGTSFAPSNLGPDPIARLLQVANEVLVWPLGPGPDPSPHVSFELYGEPAGLLVRVFRAAGFAARIVVYHTPDVDNAGRGGPSMEFRPDKDVVFDAVAGRRQFAGAVLDVAAGTLGRFGLAGYDEAWGEYPTAALLRLRRALGNVAASNETTLAQDLDELRALALGGASSAPPS